MLDYSSDGIAWITLNRPEKRNAVDYDVIQLLDTFLDDISNRTDCKLVVITGTGSQAFCSGGDLSVFHELRTEEEAYQMLSKMGGVLHKLLTLNKITIAAINGAAVGGGCELATACDFRLATSTAKLGFVQGRLGITTGWGGATMLFEKMNHHEALKLLGQASLVTAKQAVRMGFVDQLLEEVDFKEQVKKWVAPFLTQSPDVLSAYKKAAIVKWETRAFQESLYAEMRRCAILWETDAHHEAVRSFFRK